MTVCAVLMLRLVGSLTRRGLVGSGVRRCSTAASAPTPPSTAEEDPWNCLTKVELRVGVITKVWEHPDAERLFCEEIDVGEGEPRQIASGLRDHFRYAAPAACVCLSAFD